VSVTAAAGFRAAGVIAGLLSGVPSTVWALVRREDPLAATLAAGRMLRPYDSSRLRLIGAAAIAHAALSLGWAPTIGLSLPRRVSMRTAVLHGAMCGAAIAAVDLGAAHASSHARMAAIRSLPVLPQFADHVAYGVTVAAVTLTRNRRSA